MFIFLNYNIVVESLDGSLLHETLRIPHKKLYLEELNLFKHDKQFMNLDVSASSFAL